MFPFSSHNVPRASRRRLQPPERHRNHPNYTLGAAASRARGYHANTCPDPCKFWRSLIPLYAYSRVLPGTVAEPADSLLRGLYILLRAIKPPWNNIMKYMNHLLAGSHANTQCHNSSLDGRQGEPSDVSANSEDKSLGAAESRSELNKRLRAPHTTGARE